MEGIVFDIQRYSLNDGPGIRTTVFLKGCPLRCSWCANPESQSAHPEIGWFENRCLQCGKCVQRCKEGALQHIDGRIHILRDHCSLCGLCADSCPGGALKIFGKKMRVEDVLRIVEKDRAYYELSGGGMTLSGGECASQAEFSLELLRAARSRGIHTAMETSALAAPAVFARLAAAADCVYVDLKLADPGLHAQYTARGNATILQNIRALKAVNPNFTVRTPLIPGINDSTECIAAACAFLKDCGVDAIELLPYHTLGLSKYAALGRDYALAEIPAMAADRADNIAEAYLACGIRAKVMR